MTDTTCKNNQVKKENPTEMVTQSITSWKKAIADFQDNKTCLSFTATTCNTREKYVCMHIDGKKESI